MPRRLSFASALAVAASLLLIPACGKKAPPGGGSDPVVPGSSVVATEYLAFAHVNAKDIIGGELFASVKKAFGGPEGEKMWAEVEKKAVESIGVKPTDLSSLTAYVTELNGDNPPKFVAILTADKAFDKAALLKVAGIAGSAPDSNGFYTGGPGLIHFADDKTVVALSPELSDKYLAGFAKDRSAWPTSAAMAKAAEGHTLFAQVNLDKLPAEMRNAQELKQFEPLGDAKAATISLDLKRKTLSLNVRGAYADADTAGKAKDKLLGLVQVAAIGLGQAFGDESKLGAAAPAVKEAKRAIKDVKIEVNGSDVTLATSYNADFDIGAVVAGLLVPSTEKVREAAARMKSSNNLKQIGIALHSYNDVNQILPIHAIGKAGRPVTAAKAGPVAFPGDTPLLSWRVAILPFIEQEELYKQFKLDEPWDSDHNKKLIEKMPKTFEVPGGKKAKAGYTFYQMAVGPGAMPPSRTVFAAITDGTSNTIAVVEAADAVAWTKPDDVQVEKNAANVKKKFGGHFPGGFNVLMWDGSVRFISNTVTDKTFRDALTPNGGEVLGSDW